MVKPVIAVAILVLASMVAIKDGRMLRDVGLTGYCTPVWTGTDGAQAQECRRGVLEGWPDLTRQGCTAAAVAGATQLWTCPAPLVTSAAGR